MPDALPLKILVVDDDEVKRYTLNLSLRKAGFEVVEAISGEDALRMVYTRPDLIILDIHLPDISGYEVCRRLKASQATWSIPILQISATFIHTEDRVHGLESGADAYLPDVVNPPVLLATIRAMLRTRRAETALRVEARHWHVTFNAISDAVLLVDLGGIVHRCNRAVQDVLGLTIAECVGKPLAGLLPPRPAGPADADEDSLMARVLATRRRVTAELASGPRSLHLTLDPIDDGGEPAGAVCIVSDATERKQLEEDLRRKASELEETDRQKDRFLAMLGHELRNPLAPIRNALEIIRLEPDDPVKVGQMRDIAQRQVEHMVRLIDDLLDVSRITAGRIALRCGPVDLSRLVADVVAIVEGAGGHRIVVELPDTPAWIDGDRTRLEQVVINLLNNAIKFTDTDEPVSVVGECVGGEFVLKVRDRGIGIDPEMLPLVFDLFTQADFSLARNKGGLGIGLTVVRDLVEMHGGTIEAASEGLALGAEFTVRLPLLATPPAGPPAPSPPAPAEAPARPLRMLVVDDNIDSALTLARILKLVGVEVEVAHNGPDALDLIAGSERLDVVLLDIGLPGMDGYEVATRVRALNRELPIRLMALTGYGQAEDRRRSHEVGIDEHLVKPVNLEALFKLIGIPVPASPRPGP